MGWIGSRAGGTTNSWSAGVTTGSAWAAGYAIQAVAADAFLIELGANDANDARSAADYKTGLAALIDQVKANADVALVKCHPSSDAYNIPAGYLTAMDELTVSSSLKAILNFNGLSLVAADRHDTIHLSQAGYAKEASLAAAYLG